METVRFGINNFLFTREMVEIARVLNIQIYSLFSSCNPETTITIRLLTRLQIKKGEKKNKNDVRQPFRRKIQNSCNFNFFLVA